MSKILKRLKLQKMFKRKDYVYRRGYLYFKKIKRFGLMADYFEGLQTKFSRHYWEIMANPQGGWPMFKIVLTNQNKRKFFGF